jgi:hypothetical protein
LTIDLRFDEEKRTGIEEAWIRWWAGDLERPIVAIAHPGRLIDRSPREFSRNFIQQIPIDEAVDHFQSQLEETSYYGDALPSFFTSWFGIGGEIKPDPENMTVWTSSDLREEPIPLKDLHPGYDPNHAKTRGMQLRARAVERWEGKVTVSPGSLTIGLQALTGMRTSMQLLYDLVDSADEIVRLASEYTDASIRTYQAAHELLNIQKGNHGTSDWAHLWSTERYHMFQLDFICMVSSQMFERFVQSDIDKSFGQVEHAFFHLDGPEALHHLDAFLAMENLQGIQWIPGVRNPPTEEWIPLLKRIRDGGKLCQVYVGFDGARKIVREIGGRGFCFLIALGEPAPQEDIDNFLAVLAAEDSDAVGSTYSA